MIYNANFTVKIVKVGTGHQFRFSGDPDLIDRDGNCNFAVPPALKKEVLWSITIDPNSHGSYRFVEDAADAMWIHKKPETGNICPTGPYKGGQFKDFKLSADRRTLTVRNSNNDEVLYRYALRFVDDKGNRLDCDPDTGNGGGN